METTVLIKTIMGLFPKVHITQKLPKKRFGNEYGGFDIFTNKIKTDSIIYSFGIGEDISFDLDIINEFGCNVFAYDPTPKVQNWVNSQNLPPNFKFHSIGLSDNDGEISFYAPINSNHVSHTAVKINDEQHTVKVPCNKLSTLMKLNSHKHIDILKMDIEGFEYRVIKDFLDKKIKINQIAVEFHHNFKEIGNTITEKIISELIENGYELFSISEDFHEFSFILKTEFNIEN